MGVKHSILDPAPFFGELLAYSSKCIEISLALDASMLNFLTKKEYGAKVAALIGKHLFWRYIALREGHNTLMWSGLRSC